MRLGGHDIEIKPNTLAWKLFGKKNPVRMRFRHRYEVAPHYIEMLEKAGLVFSGKAPGSADYADFRDSFASIFYGHSGASLPDFAPAAASANVCRTCGGGTTKTLPATGFARLHKGHAKDARTHLLAASAKSGCFHGLGLDLDLLPHVFDLGLKLLDLLL